MSQWFASHPWVTYAIIYVFVAFIYNKVFRVGRLSLLKTLIVYLLMAVGAFILLLFQLDLELPIVYCLLVAVAMMAVVRIRIWVTQRRKR